jgi:hypothetical protein
LQNRGKDVIRGLVGGSKYYSCVIGENDVRRTAAEHLALTELTQPIPSRNKTMSIFNALETKNKKRKKEKERREEKNRLRIIVRTVLCTLKKEREREREREREGKIKKKQEKAERIF